MQDVHRRRKRAIAVCGTGTPDPSLVPLAREVGQLIIEAGCCLVCGGMGGIMEAACQGGQHAKATAASAGLVVGILPGTELDGGNPYCDLVIPTGIGVARNVLVVLSSDAVILVGGGAGTLSEAAYAWQFGRPIIALRGTGGWADQLAGRSIDDRRKGVIIEARTPREAVSSALRCTTGAC